MGINRLQCGSVWQFLICQYWDQPSVYDNSGVLPIPVPDDWKELRSECFCFIWNRVRLPLYGCLQHVGSQQPYSCCRLVPAGVSVSVQGVSGDEEQDGDWSFSRIPGTGRQVPKSSKVETDVCDVNLVGISREYFSCYDFTCHSFPYIT